MKHGRWTILAVAAVIAAAAVAGCGGSDNGPDGGLVALPASSCPNPIVRGDAKPDLLIASDLPLQGASQAQTVQMGKAVEFILKQRGFKAGKFAIGYQACDDGTVQADSWDPARCAANANAYAANRRVIGVVGPFNSGCAKIEIPILNQAGIPMVSPASTYVGLTQGGAGVEGGEPDRYYPTGRRTFARVIAADNVQGQALAVFAQTDLKLRNVFVLSDGQRAGTGLAANFTSAAGKLGLRVAGSRRWNPKAASYRPLGNAIASAGADGVFLASIADDEAGTVVRDLRAVLGPGMPILAAGGLTPVESVVGPVVRDAGAAAEGVYVSVPGPTVDRLTGPGRQFVADFGATLDGAPVVAYSAYAAQAAIVLLDAVAASDGTRASVVDNLSRTKVTDGILGSFGIDANGDTTAGGVTVYRVTGGKPATVRVVTP